MSQDERIHQVFVSSTYEDLIEERREVMQALLELDCMPAGMELFPAADDDKWTLIKSVIDRCDYYIVIVGDRYGSTGPRGMSYTQMEYEYALEQGIPTLAFIQKNPETLEPKKRETSPENLTKLSEFKSLLQEKAIRFFTSPSDLGSIVSRSIVKLMKTNPAIGWVRASIVTSNESLKEINTLQKANAELREKVAVLETKPDFVIKNIADLDEKVVLKGKYWSSYYRSYQTLETVLSWDDIFALIGPYLLQPLHRDSVKSYFESDIFKQSKKKGSSFDLDRQDFNTVTIQLRTLGLIKVETLNLVKGGVGLFWSLTRKGEELMLQSRAVTSKKQKK